MLQVVVESPVDVIKHTFWPGVGPDVEIELTEGATENNVRITAVELNNGGKPISEPVEVWAPITEEQAKDIAKDVATIIAKSAVDADVPPAVIENVKDFINEYTEAEAEAPRRSRYTKHEATPGELNQD